MTLSISGLAKTTDDRTNGYHSEGFRNEIEAQLSYIKGHASTRLVLMQNLEPVKYRGDLAGWLLKQNIREDYHWAIARVNGLPSAFDYDGTKKSFLIPSTAIIDNILQKYMSRVR